MHRYNANGLKGVIVKKQPGRKKPFTEEEEKRFIKHLKARPTEEDNIAEFYAKNIQEILA